MLSSGVGNNGAEISADTKTDNGGSITIDFGRAALLLKKFNMMQLSFIGGNANAVAASLTVYASADGEDYA